MKVLLAFDLYIPLIHLLLILLLLSDSKCFVYLFCDKGADESQLFFSLLPFTHTAKWCVFKVLWFHLSSLSFRRQPASKVRAGFRTRLQMSDVSVWKAPTHITFV